MAPMARSKLPAVVSPSHTAGPQPCFGCRVIADEARFRRRLWQPSPGADMAGCAAIIRSVSREPHTKPRRRLATPAAGSPVRVPTLPQSVIVSTALQVMLDGDACPVIGSHAIVYMRSVARCDGVVSASALRRSCANRGKRPLRLSSVPRRVSARALEPREGGRLLSCDR